MRPLPAFCSPLAAAAAARAPRDDDVLPSLSLVLSHSLSLSVSLTLSLTTHTARQPFSAQSRVGSASVDITRPPTTRESAAAAAAPLSCSRSLLLTDQNTVYHGVANPRERCGRLTSGSAQRPRVSDTTTITTLTCQKQMKFARPAAFGQAQPTNQPLTLSCKRDAIRRERASQLI